MPPENNQNYKSGSIWKTVASVVIIALVVVVIVLGMKGSNKNAEPVTQTPPAISAPQTPVSATPPVSQAFTISSQPLGTIYITGQEWPPRVDVVPGTFSCPQTNLNKIVRINSRDYCMSQVTEAAAGSTYKTYTYSTERSRKIVTLRFTLKSVVCDNYDDPQKSACEKERTTFNIDALVDQIVQSLTL